MKQRIKQLSSKFQTKEVVTLNILSAVTKKQLTLCVEKNEIQCNKKNATNALDLVNQMAHLYYPKRTIHPVKIISYFCQRRNVDKL